MEIKNILSEKEICEKFNVTPEQLDKALRVLDCQSGKVFYQVKSQSTDEVYEVRFNEEFKRLTCNCKAGRVGVPCWHKRAAMASAREYLQEQRIAAAREQAEQEAALSQKRAYESDKEWQEQERAANRGKLALNPQERKFEEFDGRSIPMR